jgi:hypothetical protein
MWLYTKEVLYIIVSLITTKKNAMHEKKNEIYQINIT